MAIATITAGSWQVVTTTTADTAFQNRSQREVYLLTGTTTDVPIREGLLLRPWEQVVISSSLAVSASAIDGPANIFYMGV